jgi:hypothetical protein
MQAIAQKPHTGAVDLSDTTPTRNDNTRYGGSGYKYTEVHIGLSEVVVLAYLLLNKLRLHFGNNPSQQSAKV